MALKYTLGVIKLNKSHRLAWMFLGMVFDAIQPDLTQDSTTVLKILSTMTSKHYGFNCCWYKKWVVNMLVVPHWIQTVYVIAFSVMVICGCMTL